MKAHGSKVGLKAFEKLKPYYVHRLLERNTCACKYHVKMVELRKGFNKMQHVSKGVMGQIATVTMMFVATLPILQVSAKLVA